MTQPNPRNQKTQDMLARLVLACGFLLVMSFVQNQVFAETAEVTVPSQGTTTTTDTSTGPSGDDGSQTIINDLAGQNPSNPPPDSTGGDSTSNDAGANLGMTPAPTPTAAPGADVCDPNGSWGQSFGRTQANIAGRLVSVHKDYMDNSPTVEAKSYCVQTILNVIKGIRIAMIAFDLKFAFMELVMGRIVDAIINAACAFVQSLVTQIRTLTDSMTLSVCLPLPQLRLGVNIPRPRLPCIGFGNNVIGAVNLSVMPRKPRNSSSTPTVDEPTQLRMNGMGEGNGFEVNTPDGY
jgi:hypothetical protein